MTYCCLWQWTEILKAYLLNYRSKHVHCSPIREKPAIIDSKRISLSWENVSKGTHIVSGATSYCEASYVSRGVTLKRITSKLYNALRNDRTYLQQLGKGYLLPKTSQARELRTVVTHAVTLTTLLSFSISIQQQYHCPLLASIVQIANGLHSENVHAIAVIL